MLVISIKIESNVWRNKMKEKLFFNCDKCIGLTPCHIQKNGKVVCDYCKNEIKLRRHAGPGSSEEKYLDEHRI
jgi:hypothetical protein